MIPLFFSQVYLTKRLQCVTSKCILEVLDYEGNECAIFAFNRQTKNGGGVIQYILTIYSLKNQI